MGERHILENTAKCHPRVMSALFWQIISQDKIDYKHTLAAKHLFCIKKQRF